MESLGFMLSSEKLKLDYGLLKKTYFRSPSIRNTIIISLTLETVDFGYSELSRDQLIAKVVHYYRIYLIYSELFPASHSSYIVNF